MPLQIRRGTKAELNAMTQPLAAGELVWVTDDQKLYVGDGVTQSSSLAPASGYNGEDAQDAAAALFTNGIHTGIAFTYDDNNNRINAVVDPAAFSGTITAAAFKGNLLASDNSIIVDSATKEIVGSFIGDILGNVVGDIKGSVFADDSTVMVDAVDISFSTQDLFIQGQTIAGTTGPVELTGDGGFTPQVRVKTNSSENPSGDILTGILNSGQVDIFVNKQDIMLSQAIDFTGGEVISSILFRAFQETSELDFGNAIGFQVDPNGVTSSTHVPGKFFVVTQPSSEGGSYNFLTFDSYGQLGIGTDVANEALDVRGNAEITGFLRVWGGVTVEDGVTRTDIIGSVFADSSTMIIDGIEGGKITAPSATLSDFLQLPVLSAEPADPADGMIVVADGIGWDPTSSGKQTLVVRLATNWIQVAVAP